MFRFVLYFLCGSSIIYQFLMALFMIRSYRILEKNSV